MSQVFLILAFTATVIANPHQYIVSGASINRRPGHGQFFDIQGHRGGRGNVVESTLPSFAWGMIEGSTTLEMDNGVTMDGTVVVWHDQEILPSKCQDTVPALPDDPLYPYVGKYIANLTIAQIKTLDCGSKRQPEFPRQLTYPGTRISTLQEVFDFLDCADPQHHMLLNIESKIDPSQPNQTMPVEVFVEKQHALFYRSNYYHTITYQSFDWRSLIAMKQMDPIIITSALVDNVTIHVPEGHTKSPWLGGLDISDFNGSTVGERIAQAADFIKADILSPLATLSDTVCANTDTTDPLLFTTPDMVRLAHDLGILVKPWTVNWLDIADKLLEIGVDGIITDVPETLRRWAQQNMLSVAPKYPKHRVLSCLAKHTTDFLVN